MSTNRTPHAEDLRWVQRILDGDERAWNRFVEVFSDRIWRRSWQLCNEACPHNKANVFCVFHALAADTVKPSSDERPGCDEGLEIYAFIFEYFHNAAKETGKLKHFDGRSKIETFVASVLHGNLRTDWIRHKRKLRVDQITLPEEIKRLPKSDQRVYRQMVMQRPTETISRKTGLSPDDVTMAQERITHALMANGNLHLILRSPEGSIEDLGYGEDTMSARAIPLRQTVERIWEVVCDLIRELPEQQKILLDLVFDEELDAKVILARVGELELELPVSPRSGKMTIHTIYQSVDHILKDLGTKLQSHDSDVLQDARTWLDDDSIDGSISSKGLKALLKNMGISRTSDDAPRLAHG
ncbi:MAG: hypothetical protein R3178_08705 [Rhodothermales bacterium]|nr:hypothetical protein [Rhodothermales bacterium]